MGPPGANVRPMRAKSTTHPVLTILVGEALYLASWRIGAWTLFLAVAFHLRVLRYEEPVLREAFGAAFDEYCREAPRWIPRIGGAGDG